ncbi:MAG TPA: 16S rRNA (cytidine(1402)-2'-O)-methyltransferase [Steroidobacteraceae bacterium]|nr:16S rRNA (cytidine(1402)-2'-O)-methyltransferase [Steroidobacteraceae bacterium]
MARRDQVRAAEHAASRAQRNARGRLDVVATPIGNLADLTPRARDALAAADLVAAEDTRHTGALLRALGIQAPLLSLHDYNESARVQELIERMHAGAIVALVSDAGTPLVSDPGYALVRAASEAGITVRALPGPSALTAALSIAGLPTDRFVFEGFLPARASARRARLLALVSEPRTLVFFEAPHRIATTLRDLAALFGGARRAVIARELTKLHESAHRGALAALLRSLDAEPNMARGEITLIVEGAGEEISAGAEPEAAAVAAATGAEADTDTGTDTGTGVGTGVGVDTDAGSGAGRSAAGAGARGALLAQALRLLLAELPPGRAAAIAAQLAGVPRREAYALAQRLRDAQEVEPPP